MLLKKLCCMTLSLVMLFIMCSCSSKTNSMSDKLIRFHVIANSDSSEDQSLKLKVRDRVLKEIEPRLEKSKSREESEKIINDSLGTIKQIAEKVIIENKQNYNVAVSLGKSMFPAKMYSNIVLPAGEYDALKIIIGKGEGKNWWCVMFPPLCFIDITHGITTEETEERLKTALNDDEYNSILSSEQSQKGVVAVKKPVKDTINNDSKVGTVQPEKIEMKFKSVEIIKSLFSRIQELFSKNNK